MDEIESQLDGRPPSNSLFRAKKLILLSLNVLLLAVGSSGGPLVLRLYFLRGGSRKWLSAALQTSGFPLVLPPLLFSFLRRRRRSSFSAAKPAVFFITPPLVLYSVILGLLTGLDNFISAYGASYLPVSTSALLGSTQLGFTALFAFLIVKQKFSEFSINSVVLLTFGAAVLGVHANGNRPTGESQGKYYLGFAMTLAAAVLYALVLPLVELTYKKAKQEITYTLVMEMQCIISFSATAFCVVGMAVNRDFQAISRDAEGYGLGETKYYLVLVSIALLSQCYFQGLVGTIKYSSALLSGVVIAICIPVTEVLGVLCFREKFDGEKGVALALSLWGSASYFYGEYKLNKKREAAVGAVTDGAGENPAPQEHHRSSSVPSLLELQTVR
ncbi:Purine permease 3 [Apostasia shenzhenica]|uniref:Probable purine permease n=1 Tax=Apostasia shenzhenica TaxID=1088818 RepID=A0A2I0A0H3_9ASPA|nr:Purine permease 3 [Apostasia shenzhenica]